MNTAKLTCEVKTRVPRKVRRGLEQIAADRHLDLSDIAREAFRDFLDRQKTEDEAQKVEAA